MVYATTIGRLKTATTAPGVHVQVTTSVEATAHSVGVLTAATRRSLVSSCGDSAGLGTAIAASALR